MNIIESLLNLLFERQPESTAAKQAHALKLTYKGWNTWGPEGGEATHRTDDNGKLVPIGGAAPGTPPAKTTSRPSTPIKSTTPPKGTSRKISPDALPARGLYAKPPKRVIRKVEGATADGIARRFGRQTGIGGIMKVLLGQIKTEEGDAGAGTAQSKASEAAGVLVLNHLIAARKKNPKVPINKFIQDNREEVEKLIGELHGIKGSFLKADWLVPTYRQAVAAFKYAEKHHGGIEDVVWDNWDGREKFKLGPKPQRDRSDIYVKTKDGSTLGVSLKKNGNVFLANQGLEAELERMAASTTDSATQQKLMSVSERHTETTKTAFAKAQQNAASKREMLIPSLKRFRRDMNSDLSVSKYDKYFDKKTGTMLTDQAIKILVSGGNLGTKTNKKGEPISGWSGEDKKLFTRVMGSLAKAAVRDEKYKVPKEITEQLTKMRLADREALDSFLRLVDEDKGVKSVVQRFLIDALELPQLLSPKKPFGRDNSIDRVVTVYGLPSSEDEESGLIVDRSTILETLGIDKNTNPNDLEKVLQDKFIIDTDEAKGVGFIRLRIVNPNPPPPYFYPAICSLNVRAKGLGTAPAMELEQHSGWTNTVQNKSPDPRNWPPKAQVGMMKETVEFLKRHLKNSVLTPAQRKKVKDEQTWYEQELEKISGVKENIILEDTTPSYYQRFKGVPPEILNRELTYNPIDKATGRLRIDKKTGAPKISRVKLSNVLFTPSKYEKYPALVNAAHQMAAPYMNKDKEEEPAEPEEPLEDPTIATASPPPSTAPLAKPISKPAHTDVPGPTKIGHVFPANHHLAMRKKFSVKQLRHLTPYKNKKTAEKHLMLLLLSVLLYFKKHKKVIIQKYFGHREDLPILKRLAKQIVDTFPTNEKLISASIDTLSNHDGDLVFTFDKTVVRICDFDGFANGINVHAEGGNVEQRVGKLMTKLLPVSTLQQPDSYYFIHDVLAPIGDLSLIGSPDITIETGKVLYTVKNINPTEILVGVPNKNGDGYIISFAKEFTDLLDIN
jgi:hypothetical protein